MDCGPVGGLEVGKALVSSPGRIPDMGTYPQFRRLVSAEDDVVGVK